MNPEHKSHEPSWAEQSAKPEVDTSPEKAAANSAEQHTDTPEVPHKMGFVAVESIRLAKEVPSIDWDAVRNLAQPRESTLRKIKDLGEFTPSVASAVANRHNSETAFIPPTAEAIKEHKPIAKFISTVLGFFSSSLADRFDNYLVDRATKNIFSTADRIIYVLESMRAIEEPKKQFVDEISAIYGRLIGKDKDAPEKHRLSQIVGAVRERQQHWVPNQNEWFNKERFPLSSEVLPKLPLPSRYTMDRKQTMRVITPEITQGIMLFLQKYNTETTQPPKPDNSIQRRIAQKVMHDRLSRLPEKVTTMLDNTYKSLPNSGKNFADDVYRLCKNITKFANDGMDGKQIVDAILEDLKADSSDNSSTKKTQ